MVVAVIVSGVMNVIVFDVVFGVVLEGIVVDADFVVGIVVVFVGIFDVVFGVLVFGEEVVFGIVVFIDGLVGGVVRRRTPFPPVGPGGPGRSSI